MDRLKKVISEHKGLSVVVGLAIIFLVIFIIICLSLIVSGNADPYGDRLDGIDKVKLSDKKLSNVASSIKDEEVVSDAKVRLQGKMVYIDIYFVNGTKLDKAKEIASATLAKFDDDEKKYYDFEYLLKEKASDTDSNYVPFAVAGTKHPSTDGITWVKS